MSAAAHAPRWGYTRLLEREIGIGIEIEAMSLGHEKLDVDCLAVDYVAWVFAQGGSNRSNVEHVRCRGYTGQEEPKTFSIDAIHPDFDFDPNNDGPV